VSGIDDRITVGEYADEWLATKRHTVAESTLLSYTQTLRDHVPPALLAVRMKDLRRAQVRQIMTALLRAGMRHTTVAKVLGVVRTFCAAAVDEELLETNPCAQLGRTLRLRTQERDQIQAMTRVQLERFLDAARRLPSASAFSVLAWTGIRIGELCGLQEADLDFEAHQIRVERQVYPQGRVARLKTRHARRAVDMAGDLEPILRRLLAQRGGRGLAGDDVGPWLFLPAQWTGGTVKNYQERLRRAVTALCRAAGIPDHFTPHDFRHTYATNLLEAGAQPQYVQQQLGHSSIKITVDTYGAWIRRRDLGAVDDLARRTGGAQFGLDLGRTGDVVAFRASEGT
jgi:integrase